MPNLNLLNLADIYREADRSRAAQIQFDQYNRGLDKEASLASVISGSMDDQDPILSYRKAAKMAADRGLGQEAVKLSTLADTLEMKRLAAQQKGAGLYGGTQWLVDKKGNPALASIDEVTRQPVVINPPPGLQWAPPISPQITTYDEQGRPVTNVATRTQVAATAQGFPGRPGVPVATGPAKPLPSAAQDDFNSFNSVYRSLDIMEKNIGKSGIGTGIVSKGTAALGTDKGAVDFETARNNLRVQAQSLIKGIPSNFDVQTFIATMPSLTSAKESNKSRIDFMRQMTDDILKSAISYYKGTGFNIPTHYVALASKRGIDVTNIAPWDGVTDPLASLEKYQQQAPEQKPQAGDWGIRRIP